MSTEPVTQFIWTLKVTANYDELAIRRFNFVAPYDFDEAHKIGKELLARKFPNTLKEIAPEHAWHPDLEIIGLRRGQELANDKQEQW